MNLPTIQVSVLTPLTPALERVKTILFRPFDLNKWMVIGFCAWLAFLGQSGGGGGGGGGGTHWRTGRHEVRQLRHALQRAWDYVRDNLTWIVPLAVTALLVAVALWLVFTWLSSRGKFMFLHCVARNCAEVSLPWTRYGEAANSLFLFRIALDLVGLLAAAPFVGLALVLGAMVLRQEGGVPWPILGIVAACLGLVGVGLAFALVKKLTFDFVVPRMYLGTASCRAAWGEVLPLLGDHVGRFLLYLLFSILLAVGLGLAILIVVLMTCCVAGCLLVLPYVGTVLLLPVLVFKRSYSLYYLAQYGSGWDVFADEAPPVMATV